MSRVNPYTALQTAAREWARTVRYAKRAIMWTYPKAKLRENWRLDDLAERVAAANQLGYDVKLEAADDGLRVVYVKRPPDAPWEICP